MNNNGWVSFLFVVLGIILICVSSYLSISSGGGSMAFLNPILSLSFSMPLLLVFLSLIMFVGGFYYHKAKNSEVVAQEAVAERQMVERIAAKIAKEKGV